MRRHGIFLIGMALVLMFAILAMAGCRSNSGEEIQLQLPENFYQVSEDLFRSGQPLPEEYDAMQFHGIRSVLNLRFHHEDQPDSRFVWLWVPMNAGSLTRQNLLDALRSFERADKPVLVHCWHGSDRTGAFCAAYRIVYQQWPVERAIAELEEPQYGHHQLWYGNIPELLRAIDWDAMRAEVSRGEP